MTIQLSMPADLLRMVGQEIGTGEWHAITQHQVNIFADATHDHQWIHVEPERAAKGPYGGPIAHGYLTLSFCPVFLDDVRGQPGPLPGAGAGRQQDTRTRDAGSRRTKADRPRVRVRDPRRARGVGPAGLRHRDGRYLPVVPPMAKQE